MQRNSYLGYGTTNYRGEKSDDDYQRGNSRHHWLDGSGQDRFRQKFRPLYTVKAKELGKDLHERLRQDEWYCLLQSVGPRGPEDREWVSERRIIEKSGDNRRDKLVYVR